MADRGGTCPAGRGSRILRARSAFVRARSSPRTSPSRPRPAALAPRSSPRTDPRARASVARACPGARGEREKRGGALAGHRPADPTAARRPCSSGCSAAAAAAAACVPQRRRGGSAPWRGDIQRRAPAAGPSSVAPVFFFSSFRPRPPFGSRRSSSPPADPVSSRFPRPPPCADALHAREARDAASQEDGGRARKAKEFNRAKNKRAAPSA